MCLGARAVQRYLVEYCRLRKTLFALDPVQEGRRDRSLLFASLLSRNAVFVSALATLRPWNLLSA